MLEPVEVSSQPWICSYGQAPSHCGYALARTSYDGYAPMDMPLPTVDMPLPGPSMTDMLLWICSFPLWICPGQDTLPWICSFQLWIGPCQDTLPWTCSCGYAVMDMFLPTMDMLLPSGYAVMDMFLSTMDMLLPGSRMVDMRLWIRSSHLWVCPCQDHLWWISSYGHAHLSYNDAPARISSYGYDGWI